MVIASGNRIIKIAKDVEVNVKTATKAVKV